LLANGDSPAPGLIQRHPSCPTCSNYSSVQASRLARSKRRRAILSTRTTRTSAIRTGERWWNWWCRRKALRIRRASPTNRARNWTRSAD